jgi:hypothetical protein
MQVPLHQGQRWPGPYPKKRTDSKKGPFFGRFVRKTGGWRGNKSTLFCTFSRFGGFLRLQVIVCQNLLKNGSLQKKSRRKTYGRFFVFWELWHDRTMINENSIGSTGCRKCTPSWRRNSRAARPKTKPVALAHGRLPEFIGKV